jgi:hypothetical protein
MAKITRKLDDIEKLIQKEQQTPAERLAEVKKELATIQEVNFNDKIERKPLEREQTLLKAKKILEKQVEEIEEKQAQTDIKRMHNIIDIAVYQNLDEIFKAKEVKGKLLKVYETLQLSKIKDLFINELIEDLSINNDDVKELADFYLPYIRESYDKQLKKLYNYYKGDIQEELKNKRIEQQNAKIRQKNREQTLNNIIKFHAGVIALGKAINRKKRYR